MKKLLVVIVVMCSLVANAQVSFTRNQFVELGISLDKAMVDIADMDNDGDTEVITMYRSSQQNDTIYLGIYKINEDSVNTTTQRFAIKSVPNSNFAMRNFVVLNANVQSDNRKDIAYVHSDSVTILFQKSNGTFSMDSSVTMYSGMTTDGIAKGDFNKDGRDDFVTCNWNDDHLTVFVQSNGGFYAYDNIFAVQAGYNQIKVADVDGDGWDDIIFLAGQTMSSGVYVYHNTDGYFTTPPIAMQMTSNTSGTVVLTQSVSFGNFFGTGSKMLLSTNTTYTDPNSSVFTTDGTLEQTLSLTSFNKSTTVGDFDSDGYDEMATLTNISTEGLMVFDFTPTLQVTSFPGQISGNFHSMTQAIVCGDIVGNDGNLDLVTISDWGGITIWKNNVHSTTGMKTQTNFTTSISIYPNPTTDYINISGVEEGTFIMIMDLSGRIVLEGEYQNQIDVSSFAPGVYYLRSGEITKKFIVQ